MGLIIKIDDALYNRVKEKIVTLSDIPVLCKAVDDSTPYKPSGDAISREALKKTISELPNANPSYGHKCDVVDRQDVLDEINDAQAVEHSLLPLSSEADNAYMRGYEVGKAEGIMKASTRPKGEYISVDKLFAKCSICGNLTRVLKKYNMPNFCPACGADMRGGEENE